MLHQSVWSESGAGIRRPLGECSDRAPRPMEDSGPCAPGIGCRGSSRARPRARTSGASSSQPRKGPLRVERMLEQLPDLLPSLVRVPLRAGVERASMETLTDVGFEFPSTNYR